MVAFPLLGSRRIATRGNSRARGVSLEARLPFFPRFHFPLSLSLAGRLVLMYSYDLPPVRLRLPLRVCGMTRTVSVGLGGSRVLRAVDL